MVLFIEIFATNKNIYSRLDKIIEDNKLMLFNNFLNNENYVRYLLKVFTSKLSYTKLGKLLHMDKTTISGYLQGKPISLINIKKVFNNLDIVLLEIEKIEKIEKDKINKLFLIKNLLKELNYKFTEEELGNELGISKAMVMKFKQYKGQKWKQELEQLDVYIEILKRLKYNYDDLYRYVYERIYKRMVNKSKGDVKNIHTFLGFGETTFYSFYKLKTKLNYDKLLFIKKRIGEYELEENQKNSLSLKFQNILIELSKYYSSKKIGRFIGVSDETIGDYKKGIFNFDIDMLILNISKLEFLKKRYKKRYKKVKKFVDKKQKQGCFIKDMSMILGIAVGTCNKIINNEFIDEKTLLKIIDNIKFHNLENELKKDTFLLEFIESSEGIENDKQSYKLFLEVFCAENRIKLIAKGKNIKYLMKRAYSKIGTNDYIDFMYSLKE